MPVVIGREPAMLTSMALLDSWAAGSHSAPVNGEDTTHPTYRKGSGPGVIVIHEIPGLTPSVIGFGEELVEAGYTVVMPVLFGTPERGMSPLTVARAFAQVCISKEFTKLARGETTPVAEWLRSLARSLHAQLGGPGVGALGMCFTGGFALAMMVDDSVAAPVVAQPSAPFAVSPGRSADLNLSPADLTTVKRRAAAGCQVLGLRYRKDPMTGTRFDTLTRELGDAFIRVELDGRGHSTVTEQRSQHAVDEVLSFFGAKLR
jgi:dienelactone hydrolase